MKPSKTILFFLLINSLGQSAFSNERNEVIKNYVSAFKGDYSPSNIEQIKAAAAANGVSTGEIDAAMGFTAGTTAQAFNTVSKSAPAPAPVAASVASAPVTSTAPAEEAAPAPIYSLPSNPVQRSEVIKNYINAYGGNYSPENLQRIKQDAINFGVSASEIDKVMGFNSGLTAQALKTVTLPPPSAGKVVNNYVPYAANLTSSQAQELSDKYKAEFGVYPSPQALTIMGHQLTGQRPVAFKDLVAKIKKQEVSGDFVANYASMLFAGIDPDVYLGLDTNDIARLNLPAIINSEQPNTALRIAKRQLLENTVKFPGQSINLLIDDIQARAGNLAVRQHGVGRTLQIFVIDKAGNQMDSSDMDSQSILKLAYQWGLTFDSEFSESLKSISEQLTNKNVQFLPGTIMPGTGLNAGVNLLDIANGGTGSANTIGDLTAAELQDARINKFLASSQYVYNSEWTYSRELASHTNYILDSLNVDPKNKSSSVNYVAPQKIMGVDRNYVVVTNPSGRSLNSEWFGSAHEAQSYLKKNGGEIYDLKTGLPNNTIDPEKYQAALAEKYPQLIEKMNQSAGATVVASSFNKAPEVLAKKTFIKSNISKTITINSGTMNNRAIGQLEAAASNPKTCVFNLSADMNLTKSVIPVKVKEQINSSEKKFSKLCTLAKTDASGVQASKLLAAYTAELASVSKKVLQEEINVTSSFRKKLNKSEKSLVVPPNYQSTGALVANAMAAINISHQAEVYKKHSDRMSNALLSSKETQKEIQKDIIQEEQKRVVASAVTFSGANKILPMSEESDSNLAYYAEMAKKDKSLQPSEDDSIFKQINKAYMRNYDRLK